MHTTSIEYKTTINIDHYQIKHTVKNTERPIVSKKHRQYGSSRRLAFPVRIQMVRRLKQNPKS